MKRFSVEELARAANAIVLRGSRDTLLTGVSTDSRTVAAGDCFFAIAGDNFDGHDFVDAAFRKGAMCAVISRPAEIAAFGDRAILQVPNVIKALGSFAREYRRNAAFKVVAVTGSVGKTTTRQIIWHVLSQHFRASQSPKNFNNHIGLPLSLFAAQPDDEIVVVELGTNHTGEISYLTHIAEPDIALVTTVEPAHLEGFNTIDAIAAEKLSIAEGLRPRGALLLNGDCPALIRQAMAQGRRFLSFGTSAACDYRAGDIRLQGLESRLIINNTAVTVPLPGGGNAMNALAAWAVCSQFGLDVADFAAALAGVSAVAMRSEVLQLRGVTVINDCYNANPASMKNALALMSSLARESKGRSVFICGDMGELGNHAENLHEQLGDEIAAAGVGVLLTAGKLAAVAADSAARASGSNLDRCSFDDAEALADNLHDFLKEGDIILVKGSRSNKLERVVEKIKDLFSPVAG